MSTKTPGLTDSPKKRRFNDAFPSIAQDDALVVPSWRTTPWSDWTLQLGPRQLKVHKLLVAYGERASAFLNTATTTSVGISHGSTDLTDLVPEALWPLVDEVLDFVYTGTLKLETSSVNHMLGVIVWADALQIKALYQYGVRAAEDLLTQAKAPEMAAEASSLLGPGVPVKDQIISASMDMIAAHFDEYTADELILLPPQLMIALLRRDDLGVVHENQVLAFMQKIVAKLPKSYCQELWRSCRLGSLSPTASLTAGLVAAIPAGAVHWASLHFGRGTYPKHAWVAPGSLRLRQPLRGVMCGLITAGGDLFDLRLAGRLRDLGASVWQGKGFMEADRSAHVVYLYATKYPRGGGGFAQFAEKLQRYVTNGGALVLVAVPGGLGGREQPRAPIPAEPAWIRRSVDIEIQQPDASVDDYDQPPWSQRHYAMPELGPASPPEAAHLLAGVDSILNEPDECELIEGARVVAQQGGTGRPLVVEHPDLPVWSLLHTTVLSHDPYVQGRGGEYWDGDSINADELQLTVNAIALLGRRTQFARKETVDL